MYDLIVVGAGPAGSTCARTAALQGLRVLLLDRRPHPRHGLIGGGLSLRVRSVLNFDLSPVIEREFRSVVIRSPSGDPILCRRNCVIGMVVSRDRFEELLLKKARDAGVEVVEDSKVVQVENVRAGIRVLCVGDSYRGHLLVGADGLDSIVAQNMRIHDKWPPEGVYLCMTTDVPMEGSEIMRLMTVMDDTSPAIEIHLGHVHFGNGWILPGANAVNVGLRCRTDYLDDLGVRWSSFIERLQEQWGVPLSIADVQTLRMPAGPLERFTARRTMLVGDAAGLVSAMTGEGVYYAIVSGQLAAEVAVETVRAQDPSHIKTYNERLALAILGGLRACQMFSETVFRTRESVEAVCRVAREDDVVRDTIVDLLTGVESYSRAISRLFRRMAVRHPLESLRISRL